MSVSEIVVACAVVGVFCVCACCGLWVGGGGVLCEVCQRVSSLRGGGWLWGHAHARCGQSPRWQ